MNEHVAAAPVAATAGNRAKVFVSYSRKDLAFAQMLVGALAERGFDAFLDKTDIAPGEPWKERLAGLIATADTVVFTVSPDSVASTICAWELEESTRLGKRIIPVVARRIADADAPPALGRLNWVFLDRRRRQGRCAGDARHGAAYRSSLGARAYAARRAGATLGRSRDAARARPCAAPTSKPPSAGSTAARPTPTRRPTCIRISSGRAGGPRPRRQRYWVGGSLAVAVVAIALAGFAEISRREAQTQRDRAERTLTLATGTANGLVFDLAQKFRNVVGVPAATIKDILDRARQLQDQLLGSGESSPALRRSQAAALIETADTLLTLGETQSALTAAKQAQEIFQALLAQQPDSTDFQRDLSVSYDEVGDVQVAQGNLPAALASYQASLAIRDRLAKSDPGNAGWQRDLSVSYDKVGDVQVAQGNLPAALTSYQASLAIIDRLAKSDPGNAGWQRDLSVSYEKVGDVQVAQGNLPAALTSYQASLAIATAWRSPIPAMPAGSATCRSRTTGSATCRWRRAICRPR